MVSIGGVWVCGVCSMGSGHVEGHMRIISFLQLWLH